jgi:hypothetical protein
VRGCVGVTPCPSCWWCHGTIWSWGCVLPQWAGEHSQAERVRGCVVATHRPRCWWCHGAIWSWDCVLPEWAGEHPLQTLVRVCVGLTQHPSWHLILSLQGSAVVEAQLHRPQDTHTPGPENMAFVVTRLSTNARQRHM